MYLCVIFVRPIRHNAKKIKIMSTKKITAPITDSMDAVLEGVRSGAYYTEYTENAIANGYTPVKFGFSVFRVLGIRGTDGYRDTFQEVEIPADQKGNLRAFAGKKCLFVVRNITKEGQMYGYIKEA